MRTWPAPSAHQTGTGSPPLPNLTPALRLLSDPIVFAPHVLRFLTAFVLLALLAFGAVRIVAFLSYGFGSNRPEETRLAAIDEPVEVSRTTGDTPYVRARTEQDAFAALGYLHAGRAAWRMVLWRQTAGGKLAEWFGKPVVNIDRTARLLGFERVSRAAYDRLPQDERFLLERYAAGVNDAFSERSVAFGDVFVLLDIEPERWEPWHSLMIERLLAWLAALPNDEEGDRGTAQKKETLERLRRPLAEWLQLFGFEYSAVWTTPHRSPGLRMRLVYGAGALPLLEPTGMSWEGTDFVGAFVPGWPAALAGTSTAHGWALIPTGDTEITVQPASGFAESTRHERITVGPEGNEVLVTVRTADDLLLVPGTDSIAIALKWNGLRPVSDFGSWRACAPGSCSGFSLTNPTGAVVSADSVVTWIGPPAPTQSGGYSRLPLPNAGFDDSAGKARAMQDVLFSSFAANLAPRLLEKLDAFESLERSNALTYLENWDYRFNRSSIGAGIFDRWIAEAGGLDRSKEIADLPADSLLSALQRALRELNMEHGPNMSAWRWEATQPAKRIYPVWGTMPGTGRAEASLPTSMRYQPITLPVAGHPTAVAYAASGMQGSSVATAFWSATLSTGAGAAITVLSPRSSNSRFLGRLNADPDTVPLRLAVGGADAGRTVTLQPIKP